MVALVDCNNFYCSCERVFIPSLNGKPVVVLSNNDGCIIARSDEAKAVGITMGVPVHQAKGLLEQHRVTMFSSNYPLYQDMSDRVMKLLSSFVPRMEVYSIDEAFLDLTGMKIDFNKLAARIRNKILKDTGLPVTIGIAPTKTLAKMANRYAKKYLLKEGFHCSVTEEERTVMLGHTSIAEVWGIGPQYATLLEKNGFPTALRMLEAPKDWIRDEMSVVGLRTLSELQGIPAVQLETITPTKKNICTSRAIGRKTDDKGILIEAVSNYAAACASKLRKEKSCAKKLHVFLQTNPFQKQDLQYTPGMTLYLDRPTNDSGEIIKYAIKAFELIYLPHYLYQKAGVIVDDLVPEGMAQGSLFDKLDRERSKKIMTTLDSINASLGREIVKFSTQGFQKRYLMKAALLSKRYTTRIQDVLQVKI